MNDRVLYYSQKIIDLLRTGKITSITIDGVLYDNYLDIADDVDITKVKINKKYIKLFKDEEFVVKHFVHDNEFLVKNKKTGRYNKLTISNHARVRFIVRFIVLMLKRTDVESHHPLLFELIMTRFIRKLKREDFVAVSNIKHLIHTFIDKYQDKIDQEIYRIFKFSNYIKNLSKEMKYRIKTHGQTNYFAHTWFLLVFSITTNTITTIEIYNSGGLGKEWKQTLNKNVHDYKNILIMLFAYCQKEKLI